MYALTVIISQAGENSTFPGTLYRIPPELSTPEQMRRYLSAPLGWSRCPLNYFIYTVNAPDGSRIIVPGINVPGERKAGRKLAGYSVTFTKDSIEKFAASILDERARIETAAASELQALTHDIRALSAEIYNAAELAKSDIQAKNLAAAEYRAETVIAAQQILSIRLDIVDFSTGQFLEQPPERIPVYKKVHKVINCLKPKAIASNVNLLPQGPSTGMTYGPPIFELIPFVLIQNALKYCPQETEIAVKVSDFLDRIDFHVQSQGPKIRAAESERIFERGYRGVEAQKTGRSGSGLGLFAAKSLVTEAFGGTLKVIQDSYPAIKDGQEYYRTTFSVSVPRVA